MSKLKNLIAARVLSKEQKLLIRNIESSFKGEIKTGEIKKTGFSASSLFFGPGECGRRWSLVFEGVDESYDEWAFYNRRAANSGTAAHEQLQEMILEANPNVILEDEFKLTLEDDGVTMRGFIDVYDPDTNTPIEIKTCNARSFDIRKEKMEPALYQMRQLLVYMHVKKAKLGLMIYECRDTFEILIIPIVMTDERKRYIERVFEWMKEVEKCKEEGLVKVFPGKRVNSKICSQCPVKAACDAADEGVLEIPLLNKYAEAE